MYPSVYITLFKKIIKDGIIRMNEENFSFIIYMIHELADSWKMLPSQVFKILKKSGCLDNYLIPHYDVLHSLGTQYLIDDIGTYVKQRGVQL